MADSDAPALGNPTWTLVPLGNPGKDYTATRHNLGRLMLQRWMADRGLRLQRKRELPSGRLLELTARIQVLLPLTWMNLSGQACAEACLPPGALILLHDDKDLPLGLGRFRLSGSTGGHNGLASVFEHLGTQDVPRLRLGIGPLQRPLHDFVLGKWTDPEWARIDRLDAPFAAFLDALAACEDLGTLPSRVNAEAWWGEP